MARNDAGRSVARAGATGGSRTYRGQRPYRWYGSLILIVLIGVFLIGYSRYERTHHVTAAVVHPTTSDAWLEGFVFDICGTVQANLPANPNQSSAKPALGLYTTGNGIMAVTPKSNADAGANATLGRFAARYPKLTFTSTSLGMPGGAVYKNGETCPKGTPDAGKKGEVQVSEWPSPSITSATSLTGSNPTLARVTATGQLFSVGFVPRGVTPQRPSQTIAAALLTELNPTTTTGAPVATPTTAGSTATTSKSTATTSKSTATTSQSTATTSQSTASTTVSTATTSSSTSSTSASATTSTT